MEKVQYELVDNVLSAEDFIRLKVATGFIERDLCSKWKRRLKTAYSTFQQYVTGK